MGNQIQKNLKISSDVTDWHDVAAGRESVCNWMMEATRYLSEFDDLGRCQLLEMGEKSFQKK